MKRLRTRHAPRGFTLIEILIALVVLAFGMLALARVIGRSAQEELEAYQRSQAMTLALEMADRITNNPKQAALYVEDYVPVGPAEDCTALPDPADLVAHDKCEWRNRLRGVDTLTSGRGIGAPIAAQGCVINTAPNIYTVAVAWQGVVPTAAADSACAADAFGDEKLRRVFSTVFQIATLGA
jgi:type IV pilus assembly protein PilV